MTDAAEQIEVDDDFSTPEPPREEVLYDDGEPVEVPEPSNDDDEPDLQPAAEVDGDTYEQARREVQTEQQVAAGTNALLSDLFTFAKGLGVDPRNAAAYVQAGKTAELLEAVQQLGLQAAAKIEDKGKRVAAEMDVKDYVRQCNQKLGQLRTVAQHIYGRKLEREQGKVEKAHQSARAKLIAECPKLDNDAEARAFQEYLVKTRGYTAEQIAGCRDHRPLAAEYKAWRAASPPPKKVLPGSARIPRKAKPVKRGEIASPGTLLARSMYGEPRNRDADVTRRIARRDKTDRLTILYGSR